MCRAMAIYISPVPTGSFKAIIQVYSEKFRSIRTNYLCFQGFLVEAKLNRLLAPLEKDEQSLMRLDAIFAVSSFTCFSDTCYGKR